ncbi:GntR family transcriptional regulator [Marinobacterium maritimum]|uniref:GntR family transcriptional regulator n=1 Tax=Marinobacterium maritimum TaxID=500162 RepID=A0ABN1I1T0_9GAMM
MSSKGKSISDQASRALVSKLKQAIGSGHYRPGEWLKQIDVEETYNVNRFTVRAALSELHSSGFLQHVPYKGYRVIEHSLQERMAITEARELIECAIAAKVMLNMDETGLNQLTAFAQAFRNAVQNQDQTRMMELNFAFHRCFNEYCRNPHLSRMVDEMRERGVGSADRGWTKRSTQEASAQDHLDMVEALREKNLIRLQALIHTHLNRWRESYTELNA